MNKIVGTMVLWGWDGEAARMRPADIEANVPIDIDGVARLLPLPPGRRCALLARESVRVNGIRCLPLQILRDRDEIRVGNKIFYFSMDSIPRVSRVHVNRTVRCARCLGCLATGDEVVRCPGCQAHHHPDCWRLGPGCQKCQHAADAVSWTPDVSW